MADESRRLYGVQFHPEVTHTLQGGEILRRFVREIAGCAASWATGNIIEDSMARIRAQVGSGPGAAGAVGRRGFVGAGGAAAPGHRRAAHLRIRRSRTAAAGRGRSGDGDLRRAHGRARHPRRCRAAFLAALAGEADPEKKRKIIGRVFIEVFDEEAAKLKDVKWLAQGTIYPDVIESAGRQDRQGARHQVAPQRRRLARDT